MENAVKSYLKETLEEIASAPETGHLGKKVRISYRYYYFRHLGSEHGESEIVRGANSFRGRRS